MKAPLIAIDGPAGAGKSSTSIAVAWKLGIPYLDTGALYRAVAWYFIRHGVNMRSPATLERQIEKSGLVFTGGANGTRVWVENREITAVLRSQELTMKVGSVCEIPTVREWLVRVQRDWARRGFGIMEGRDIGTVVLPNASLKVYITARPEVRAGRRGLELGIDDGEALSRLADEIAERDRRDAQRDESPMKPAKDAVVLDTSDLSFDEQVGSIIDLAAERFNLRIYG